jgi:hypothetical protein
MSDSDIPKLETSGTLSPASLWPDFIPIALVWALSLVLHLIAIRGFGLFRDELYYIACSNHLAWGFVDQPPLSLLLLKIIRFLFGDSPAALCFLPALGGAAFVFLTGLMARELGGKKSALLLASVAGFAPVGTTRCDFCMPYENNRAIFLCRRARFSIQEIWPSEKEFI